PDAEDNVPSLDERGENTEVSTPEDEDETVESEESEEAEQDELDEEASDIDGDESDSDVEDTDADAEEDGTSEDEDVDEAEDIEEDEEAEENTDAKEDVDEATDEEAEAEDEADEEEDNAEEEKEKPSKATLSSKKGELGNGDRDDRVVQLKKDLAKLGFAVPGSGTDQFGPRTTKKVKEFQKYYGLKVTGTLNKETESKMKQVLSTPLQKWNKHEDT